MAAPAAGRGGVGGPPARRPLHARAGGGGSTMRDRVITAEQAVELAALYRLLHGDLAAVPWFTRDGQNHTVRLPALGLVLRHYWHDKGTDEEQFAGTVEDEREV